MSLDRDDTFSSSLSLCDTKVGNLPALFSPGPRRRGICLITASEARNAAYFLAAHHTTACQTASCHLHNCLSIEAILLELIADTSRPVKCNALWDK